MISVPCDDRIEIPSSFAFERSQQSQGVADRSANTMSTVQPRRASYEVIPRVPLTTETLTRYYVTTPVPVIHVDIDLGGCWSPGSSPGTIAREH